ncbi:hypothetical protein [Variovorax sp. PBS-H4]|uniref:hypothetical protein n=1 Tax=Variovorax sp. PBS-H4 TaxID=434008 RepID=UPI0013A5788C|nr:hypothetical protein [Variovorax sp. PBS-H4]
MHLMHCARLLPGAVAPAGQLRGRANDESAAHRPEHDHVALQTTAWRWASSLAITSVAPRAANGTTSFTGLDGQPIVGPSGKRQGHEKYGEKMASTQFHRLSLCDEWREPPCRFGLDELLVPQLVEANEELNGRITVGYRLGNSNGRKPNHGWSPCASGAAVRFDGAPPDWSTDR